MKHYLLIAEKPSLMREIRTCYTKHKSEIQEKVGDIEFMALSGHVCENLSPDEYPQWDGLKWEEVDYPMVPKTWKVKAIEDGGKKKILKEIKQKASEADGMIVATDPDVEGYGIYYLLETYLHLEKKPALRFFQSSLTEKEILEALLSMTDFHKDPKHVHWTQAYLVRAHADWLFGMNASRLMTVKNGELMRVGRVKAPTIKLIYDNSMAVDGFQKQVYYQVAADYGEFRSLLCDEKGTALRFAKKEQCPECPQNGEVVSVETKREYTAPPRLFDLTTIQAEAGRTFGYTPEHTLDLIQGLYETHKVISYPRTQCRYVSSEKAKEFPMMLSHMKAYPDLAALASSVSADTIRMVQSNKQVVNDAEVQKEAHDALLPTSNCADPSKLTDEENNICHMIYAQLLMQFLPKAADDKTKALIRHGEHLFVANGKIVAEQGWRVLFRKSKDAYLPSLKKGQAVVAKQIAPVEKETEPPKRLTQATLINAMQTIANLIEDKDLKKSLADSKGIGTPATRAATIAEILKSGYAEDRKGKLYITPLGKKYIESLRDIDIVYPEFAAVMDTDIKKVQYGESDYETTYENVLEKLSAMCKKMRELPQEKPRGFAEDTNLTCPACGEKIQKNKFYFFCSNNEEHLKISRNVCGKEITEAMLKSMLSGKSTAKYSLKRKDGTKFEAGFKLDGGKLAFTSNSVEMKCPACGGAMNVNRGGAFCECGVKIFRKPYGYELDDKQFAKLVKNGETDVLSLVSKKGTDYEAKFVLNDDFAVEMKFPERKQK